jgi:hypothetical protein
MIILSVPEEDMNCFIVDPKYRDLPALQDNDFKSKMMEIAVQLVDIGQRAQFENDEVRCQVTMTENTGVTSPNYRYEFVLEKKGKGSHKIPFVLELQPSHVVLMRQTANNSAQRRKTNNGLKLAS